MDASEKVNEKKSFSFFIGNNRESDRILAISARKRISNGSRLKWEHSNNKRRLFDFDGN